MDFTVHQAEIAIQICIGVLVVAMIVIALLPVRDDDLIVSVDPDLLKAGKAALDDIERLEGKVQPATKAMLRDALRKAGVVA